MVSRLFLINTRVHVRMDLYDTHDRDLREVGTRTRSEDNTLWNRNESERPVHTAVISFTISGVMTGWKPWNRDAPYTPSLYR